jgi:A/G-specific adenine glycosylase
VSQAPLTGFQLFITTWYQQFGRHDLPWRVTFDPYTILVSELMLQQTQVERVIPKFTAFLNRFPTISSLAQAQQKEVLTLWQGLGYNRRAVFLHKCAQVVSHGFAGIFPETREELLKLPGVGPYTASALGAFAFNQPVNLIETNIRAVFIHHFFAEQEKVSDTELLPLIEQELLKTNPRLWYSALMDYGSFLKRTLPNPSKKSKHHTLQSKFAGSLRQARGEIIRLLTSEEYLSLSQLKKRMLSNIIHIEPALTQLIQEQMIHSTQKGYTLS